MAKRGKLEIIKDILDIVSKHNNKIKYTPLLRKSNLSSLRFQEYLSELFEKDLIEEINNSETKYISLTEKGFKFLEKYKTIINFIEEFEL